LVYAWAADRGASEGCGYLALRDAAAQIFSAPQRTLLLSIGDAATPSRRQLWALRELSRLAARLDMGGGLDS